MRTTPTPDSGIAFPLADRTSLPHLSHVHPRRRDVRATRQHARHLPKWLCFVDEKGAGAPGRRGVHIVRSRGRA